MVPTDSAAAGRLFSAALIEMFDASRSQAARVRGGLVSNASHLPLRRDVTGRDAVPKLCREGLAASGTTYQHALERSGLDHSTFLEVFRQGEGSLEAVLAVLAACGVEATSVTSELIFSQGGA